MIALAAFLILQTAPAAPPRVVAVSPAVGAEVAAGNIAIAVTYDQPMRDGFSYVMRDPATFPKCAPKPTQSADGRTFTLACVVEPGRDYWIGFNSAKNQKFQSIGGVPAIPALLRFSAH